MQPFKFENTNIANTAIRIAFIVVFRNIAHLQQHKLYAFADPTMHPFPKSPTARVLAVGEWAEKFGYGFSLRWAARSQASRTACLACSHFRRDWPLTRSQSRPRSRSTSSNVLPRWLRGASQPYR